MPLNTDFIINIDLLHFRVGCRKRREGIVCLSRSMDPFIAFKQNIHIEKLTNVVSSIGVVTQNISISALQWISRLRSEVLEWRGLTLSDGTFCLISPSVILTEETVQVLFCLSVLVRWRLDVTINILFYTLIQGRCVTPGQGHMQQSVLCKIGKMSKWPEL